LSYLYGPTCIVRGLTTRHQFLFSFGFSSIEIGFCPYEAVPGFSTMGARK